MHLSILFCLVVAASALPQRRTYGLPDAGGFRQEGVPLSRAGAGFGQATGGFGQATEGFGQATGGFGQGQTHVVGGGNGPVNVRAGHDVNDDDDDDDDDHVHFVSSGPGLARGSGLSHGPSVSPCGPGQVRHADGSCVQPEIVRNIFSYTAPHVPVFRAEPISVPTPKLIHNIVFVHTPEGQSALEPLVIPPPQQKTVVYVLTKEQAAGAQRIIEVPSTPDTPEVFYINVDEGANPQLPIGIDLRSALAAAASQQGQLIAGGAGGPGFGAGGPGFGAGGPGFGAGGPGLGASLGPAGGFTTIRDDDDHDDSGEALGGPAFGASAGPSPREGYSFPQPAQSFRTP